MANYICYPLTDIPAHDVVKIEVPASTTVYAGHILMAEALDTTDSDNRDVYLGTKLAAVATDYPCIIINSGFYEDSDGRRPAGHPNPSELSYTAGDVVTAIRLRKGYRFYISEDSVESTTALAVGNYLIPQAADTELDSNAALGTCVTGLIIEKLEAMPQGGAFGATFADGCLARVKVGL